MTDRDPRGAGAPSDQALSDALGATAGWEVDAVAAAVVGPAGVLATVGPTDRAFRLASVTKLLTAHACLVAVEEGTLDLDAEVEPQGTVRQLLAHAAGHGFDGGIMAPPGQRRIYSNAGFEALGDHLARRSAMDFVDYLGAAVFEPLGMTGTDLRDGSPAHGAWSSVDDLARFARELMAPVLIDARTLADATTVVFPGLDGVLPGVGPQSPNDWGLGFELRGHKSPHWTGATNDPSTFGHFGGAGTFLWVDPTIERALVVLTDRDFGPWALDAWPPLADAVIAAHR